MGSQRQRIGFPAVAVSRQLSAAVLATALASGCAGRSGPSSVAAESPDDADACNTTLTTCCEDMAAVGGRASVLCPFLEERNTPCLEALTSIAVMYRDTNLGTAPDSCPSLPKPDAVEITADTTPDDCLRPMAYGPVRFADQFVDQRRGLPESLASYIAAPYTIETCSTAAHYAYLSTLACPNGAPAFMSREDVYGARIGQAGDRQGRCGTIVDHYTIPCGDSPVDLYMDGYYCTVSESFYPPLRGEPRVSSGMQLAHRGLLM